MHLAVTQPVNNKCYSVISLNESLAYTCDENYTNQNILSTLKMVFYDTMVSQVEPDKHAEWLAVKTKL